MRTPEYQRRRPRPVQYVELDLPKKVKIGLSAANISAKPYTATFENFALINNETQIQALYGDIEMPKEEAWQMPRRKPNDAVRAPKPAVRARRSLDQAHRPPTTVNSAVEPGGFATSTRIAARRPCGHIDSQR